MNKLKQNIFWVFCGVLGAVLVVIFAIVVFPLWAEREGIHSEVTGIKKKLGTALLGEGVAGDADIKAWEQRQQDYKEDYKALAKLYLDRDNELQKWFKEVQDVIKPGETPRYNQFVDYYRSHAQEIENTLKGVGVEIGIADRASSGGGDEAKIHFGFNWEKLGDVPWDQLTKKDEEEALRTLQRRFWIANHVANACAPSQDGRPQQVALRLLDLRFFRRVGENKTIWKELEYDIMGGRAPHYWLSGSWAKAPPPGQPFFEHDLPDRLGQTITFGVGVEVSFEKVPVFLYHLLNPQQSPQILLNITGCRIFAATQNDPEIKEDVPFDPIKENAGDALARWKADKQKTIKPVPATIWLVCQALDFEPGALPKWATQTP